MPLHLTTAYGRPATLSTYPPSLQIEKRGEQDENFPIWSGPSMKGEFACWALADTCQHLFNEDFEPLVQFRDVTSEFRD